MSRNARLQSIKERYKRAGQPWPATAKQITTWAMRTGLLTADPADLLSLLTHQMSRALREEYVVDPQGRRVRANHSARVAEAGGEQLDMWGNAAAGRDFMELALRQRRQQVVGDLFQLKQDTDSYNENHNPGPPIQLELNFRDDVAEREFLAREEHGDGHSVH